jgi:hypothetical protein
MLYVSMRFEWKLSVGAIAALFHDTIITMGFFSVFGWEFDMTVLSAILALVGYSINDTIVVYAIDGATGQLTWVENEPIRGKTPRNFVVSPDGKWLLAAGQQSDSVTVFAIEARTGALEFADSQIKISSPVCIRFLTKF